MKSWFERAQFYDPERERLGFELDRLASCAGRPLRILDLGCGYGRNLRFLLDRGYEAVGVDVNSEIAAANIAAGLPSLTVEAAEKQYASYDVLLCSHIVEHFAPNDLLTFLNQWLDRLPRGGHLAILTRTFNPLFSTISIT